MLTAGISASFGRTQRPQHQRAICAPLPPKLAHQLARWDVQQQQRIVYRDRCRVVAAGLPFFGGLGCLPLLIFAPFVAAIVTIWSILATIQFIVASTVLLGVASVAAWILLPQVRSIADRFFKVDEDNPQQVKGRKSDMVIDIEADPEVDQAYDDLDQDLRQFDRDLRRRRK